MSNAGTVEFLLEEQPGMEPRFYFLEVNTRLQVEHPVTELLTGLDLVQLQLQGRRWEAVTVHSGGGDGAGPCVGSPYLRRRPGDGISAVSWAAGAVDCADRAGHSRGFGGWNAAVKFPPYYDPMLAKLIVQSATRAEALARMEQALENFPVLGVQTNIAYLLAIVRQPAFQAGELSTGFLAEHFPHWSPCADVPQDVLLALARGSSDTPRAVFGRKDNGQRRRHA